MTSLARIIEEELDVLTKQSHKIPMINPVLTLAEQLSLDLDRGHLTIEEIEKTLEDFTRRAVLVRATKMRKMLGMGDKNSVSRICSQAIEAVPEKQDYQHRYHLVFTAHPIFALDKQDSETLSDAIADQRVKPPAIKPLENISLKEEHARAMKAIDQARDGLLNLNRARLQQLKNKQVSIKNLQPIAMNLACWVGYDLDGRDDISWIDSFCFRLEEKYRILSYYSTRLQQDIPDLKSILEKVLYEQQATLEDLQHFLAYQNGSQPLSKAANILTERSDKIINTQQWQDILQDYWNQHQDQQQGVEALLLSWEMKHYSLGIGEIHLRLNALQVRNAMRSVDGRGISESREGESSRQLFERLNTRISGVEPEAVNFHDLDMERATASRLMMLSKQIFKHIDSVQPIRLLIAECERPLTLLSSLYLAKRYAVSEHIDISPLFETRLGLEHGAEVIEQVLCSKHYSKYIKNRKRLAIQTGFSDAGRFVGQLPATLAIERLQIKIAQIHQKNFNSDTALLIFNTHGESLGRGGARGSLRARQEYIFSPHAREYCRKNNINIIHESSFQGGDGYLWFQNSDLASSLIARLYEAEFTSKATVDDPFYHHQDLALDFFIKIKDWQENLFKNPDYGHLLDLFGNNMLPKTGSRPSNRASSSLGSRRDPSKIRAIVHNALLQQAGYLVNVTGGIGHAIQLDIDRLHELYTKSDRLKLLMSHAHEARNLGSTNCLLAYGTLFQRSFWINRAYRSGKESHLRSCRSIADALVDDQRAEAVSRLTTILRDDLLDLRSFEKRIDGGSHISPLGKEQNLINSLHIVRLVLIIEIMFLISRVPRFAEHNATGREDLIRMALSLDIPTVINIIEKEFRLGKKDQNQEHFSEKGHQTKQQQHYIVIESKILIPMKRMFRMIRQISMLIGCLYGGHG